MNRPVNQLPGQMQIAFQLDPNGPAEIKRRNQLLKEALIAILDDIDSRASVGGGISGSTKSPGYDARVPEQTPAVQITPISLQYLSDDEPYDAWAEIGYTR